MAVTINKPGGVILELDNGSREYVPYGAAVPSNISVEQQQHISNFADATVREAPDAALLRDAHQRAADASAGPLSSAHPVPGNFHELDEDGAINFVRVLEQWPITQARVIEHERTHQGRQAVIDAATDEARRHADALIVADGGESAFGNPEPDAAPETGSEAGEGDIEDAKPKTGKPAARRKAGEGDTPPPSS